MTDDLDQSQRAADIKLARAAFLETANVCAAAGAHPVVICEGAMLAVCVLNQMYLGGQVQLVEWLRNAADSIEGLLLADMPAPVIN
jgi:hypothetical protein